MPRSRVISVFGAPFATLLLVGVACGGAKSTDLFDSPPASTDTSTTTDDNGTVSKADASQEDSSTGTPKDSGVLIEEACGKDITCESPNLCCITRAAGGRLSFACSAAASCTGISFPCDSEDDCPSGSECCGTSVGGILESVACGSCSKSTSSVRRLCDPKATIDECEAVNQQCRYDSNLGIARCQN